MPGHLAGRGAQRHDRVGVAVVAWPRAAEEVRRGAGRRQEDQVPGRVVGHDAPHVCGAGGGERVPVQPAACGSPGFRGTGSKLQRSAPLRRSKARTAPLGPSLRRNLVLFAEPTTTTEPATVGGDENCTSPCRKFTGRPMRCARSSASASTSALTSTVPALAKVLAGAPGAGIHGDQPQVARAHEQPVGAGGGGGRLAVLPVGDAAAVVAGADRPEFQLRVEDPAFPARGRDRARSGD